MGKPPKLVEYDQVNAGIERYKAYYKSLKEKGCIPKSIVPLEVEIELTNACNLKCKMCNQWSWYSKNKDKETTLSTEKLKSLFEELAEMGVNSVLLTGGEPLLRKDFLELVKYADGLGLKGAVQTNGLLLSEEIAEELFKQGWYVSVSIDSPFKDGYEKIRGVEGSFDQVIKNITKASKIKKRYNKGELRIPLVIQKENSNHLKEFAEFAAKLDVDDLSCNFACSLGPGFIGKEDIKNIKRISKDFLKGFIHEEKFFDLMEGMFWQWIKALLIGDMKENDLINGRPIKTLLKEKPVRCFASDFILINALGDVYPCCYQFNVEQNRKEAVMGNIHKQRFKDIWFGERFNEARKNLLPVDPDKRLCFNCQWCEKYFDLKKIEKLVFDEKKEEVNKIKEDVIIILNSKCNNNCEFCNKINPVPEDYKELSTEKIKQLISLNHQIYNVGIVFSGKESGLRKDIFNLIKYAKQTGFKFVQLNTNGRIFSYANFCKKAKAAGLDKVGVNIFGQCAEEHDKMTKTSGSFKQTLSGIKNLMSSGINVVVNLVENDNGTIKQKEMTKNELNRLLKLERSNSANVNVHRINRLRQWSEGKEGGPLSIVLFPTDKCNLNCIYCWKQEHESIKEEVNDKRLLRLIDEAKELEVKDWIIEGGGEPFCRKELVMELMKRIRANKMNGCLITNGTLFDEKDMEEIVKSGWNSVIFSLDSHKEETQDLVRGKKGTFTKIINNINKFNDIKSKYSSKYPWTAIQAVLTNQNYKDLIGLVVLAKKLHVNEITLLGLSDDNSKVKELYLSEEQDREVKDIISKAEKLAGNFGISNNLGNFTRFGLSKNVDVGKRMKKESNKTLNRSLQNAPCFEPWLQLAINAEGNVGICCLSKFEIDNIKNKSLKELWGGNNLSKLREDFMSGDMKDYCNNCELNFYMKTKRLKKGLKDE